MWREKFVENQKSYFPEADKQVLYFIADFINHSGNDEIMQNLFHNGYCYYFAHMLKVAFQRGNVCLAAPYGHFVWVDENGVPYDIEGVNITEAEYYIPEKFMGEMVKDFLHIRNVSYKATKDDVANLMALYEENIKNPKSI